MKKFTIIAVCFTMMFLFFQSAEAQTAKSIFDRMLEEYSESIEDVETMMMVIRMEGFMETEDPDTTYYRKVMRDGYPVMEVVGSGSETTATGYYNIQDNYNALVENSEYEGTETVNGRETHVIFIEDVSALYSEMVTTEVEREGRQSEPQSGRMYIDADDYIPIRMNFEIKFDENNTGAADIQMMDIREVDGMMVPYEMVMKFQGISDSMSKEDLEETREQLDELEKQMENASGMQKRMMDRILKPQMERLRKILDEDGLTMRTFVVDVQTNIEIPEQN